MSALLGAFVTHFGSVFHLGKKDNNHTQSNHSYSDSSNCDVSLNMLHNFAVTSRDVEKAKKGQHDHEAG